VEAADVSTQPHVSLETPRDFKQCDVSFAGIARAGYVEAIGRMEAPHFWNL